MKRQDYVQLEEQYLLKGQTRYPFALEEAEGVQLRDCEGKSILDFSGGGGRTSLGQGNPAISEAVLEQLLQCTHTAQGLHATSSLRLAELLCQRSGLSQACFLSSGREARRLMLALARAHSRIRYGAERTQILHICGADCGELGLVPVSAHMDRLREQRVTGVCAVLLEPCPISLDGEPLSRQFVHELTVFCAEQDWLLLVDESLSGAGRSGSLFAVQEYGVLPDLLCFADSIAAGLPLGGVLLGSRCCEPMDAALCADFALGGSPLSAAAACALLASLNEDLLAQAKEKGLYLRTSLHAKNLPFVEHISGDGLLLGLRLVEGQKAEALAAQLLEGGLLTMVAGESLLLLLPPLTVEQGELDAALEILEQFGRIENESRAAAMDKEGE